jgi:hypothetical protein
MFSGGGGQDVVGGLAVGAGDRDGLRVNGFEGTGIAEVRDGDGKFAIGTGKKQGMHKLGDGDGRRHGRLLVTIRVNFE